MLYDPKWEVKTKPDLLSLESLAAWLEKQPADRAYCYIDNGSCLLGQYFVGMGLTNIQVGGSEFAHAGSGGRDILLPVTFQDIAYDHPRTFGAALERARAVAR